MKQSRFIRNIWLGIDNLLLHKLRSFLTMLGVVFGVGSVVAMLAVGEGASKEALRQIQKLGSNNIIISSIKSIEEEASSTQRSYMSIYGLTYLDYQRISESFENIRKVAPAKLIRKESRLGSNTLSLRIVGTTEGWFELVPRQILAGRVFNKNDDLESSAVTVLTEYGARKLLATRNTIGQTIKIGGDCFEVIGIIKSNGFTFISTAKAAIIGSIISVVAVLDVNSVKRDIIPVKDAKEAVAVANDSVFGLGAAVFTGDAARGEEIAARQLEAGCCFVNAFVRSDPRLPFGGVKESGYGRELGQYGIKEFVNIKTVYVK